MASLADQAHAAQIIGRLHYLLAADSVWTRGVGRGQAEEIEALGIVKDEMLTTLATLRGDVPFIRGLVSELDEDAGERPLSRPQVPDGLKTSFRRVIERHGGFVKFTTEQLETFDARLDEQQASIVADYDRMRGGIPPTIRGGSSAAGLAAGAVLIALGVATDNPDLVTTGAVLVVVSA